MSVLHILVLCATAVAVAWSAVVDLTRSPFVLANSAEVGVPRSVLPVLAGLKLAGAAGLLAGLVGLRAVEVSAAIGLVAFFTGAVLVHVRARVFHNIYFPGTYLALALASLTLGVLA